MGLIRPPGLCSHILVWLQMTAKHLLNPNEALFEGARFIYYVLPENGAHASVCVCTYEPTNLEDRKFFQLRSFVKTQARSCTRVHESVTAFFSIQLRFVFVLFVFFYIRVVHISH